MSIVFSIWTVCSSMCDDQRHCRKPIVTAVQGICFTVGIEMALAGDIGFEVGVAGTTVDAIPFFSGEDQARYVVTVPSEQAGLVLAKMKGAGVPCARIGATGGDVIAIAGETPVSVAALKTGFEGWFPAFMNGAN